MALKELVDLAGTIAGNETAAGNTNRNALLAESYKLQAGAGPENAIAAQAKVAEVQNEATTYSAAQTVKMLNASTEQYSAYKQTFNAMQNDVKLHQSVIDENNARVTALESDPKSNNIFLHPLKTIGAMFEKANIHDINQAHVVELNSIIAKQNTTTAIFQAERKQLQDNIQAETSATLQRDYVTKLTLAQQQELAAEERQKFAADKSKALLSGAASMHYEEDGQSGAALRNKGIDDWTLHFTVAAKNGQPLEATWSSPEAKAQAITLYTSRTPEEKASLADLASRYYGDVQHGAGPVAPRDYVANDMFKTSDDKHASAINLFLDNPNQQFEAIGKSVALNEIAAAEAKGQTAGAGAGINPRGKGSEIKQASDQSDIIAGLRGLKPVQLIAKGAQHVMTDVSTSVGNNTTALHTATTNVATLTQDPYIAQIVQQDPGFHQELTTIANDTSMAYGDVIDSKLVRLTQALAAKGLKPEQSALILRDWLQTSAMSGYMAFGGRYAAQIPQAQDILARTGTEIKIPILRRAVDAPGIFTGNATPDGTDLSNAGSLQLYVRSLELKAKGYTPPANVVPATMGLGGVTKF